MESWVWVLIGFIGGIIVYAILNLIFAKDPSDELEKLADERAAELAKAEMKTAVLQDKLVDAETARDEQEAKSEAECQEKLREADYACQQRLAEAETVYQEQLAAAEAAHQAQLATVKAQFANLESTFAEKAAEIGAALAAVGMGMKPAGAGAEDSNVDLEVTGEDELGSLEADDDLLEAAVPADALAAALAVDMGDEGLVEPTTKIDDVEYDEYGEFETASAENGVGAVASELEPENGPYIESDLVVEEDDSDSMQAAEVAVAAGAAFAAGELLGDGDDEGDQEIIEVEAAAATEVVTAAVEEQGESWDESLAEELEPALRDLGLDDVPWDERPLAEDGDESEDGDPFAGPAAAAVLEAAAQELADADGEEEMDAGPEEAAGAPVLPEAIEGEAPQVSALDTEVVEPVDDEAETAAQADDRYKEDEAASAAAAIMDQARVDQDAIAVEEAASETTWPEDTSIWTGAYFNNMKLEGEPVLVREDAVVDFDWGMGSPAPEVKDDGFSVRWTRTADLPPGLYRFTVTSDDGARLWVNDRLVISAWYDHTEMTFRREIELAGGPVDLRLEYYEHEMAALVRVSWEKIG